MGIYTSQGDGKRACVYLYLLYLSFLCHKQIIKKQEVERNLGMFVLRHSWSDAVQPGCMFVCALCESEVIISGALSSDL